MTISSSRTTELRQRLLEGVPVEEEIRHPAGIRTAIWEGGTGEPMVLLHGPGEFAAVWNRVIPDLVATHRVVVPDLPGHGASGVGSDKLTLQRVMEWIDELIAEHCESPPILVGHLLGGAIAARHAARRPDRVAHVVLVDSFGLARFRPTAAFALAMAGFVVRPTPRTQGRLMDACMSDLDSLRREMDGGLELWEAYALDRARGPSLKKAMRSLMPALAMPAIPDEELARISAPVSLIWGRDDLQVRLEVAKEAASRHGWPLHVIEDCGDDPAAERPEAFLAALRAALSA